MTIRVLRLLAAIGAVFALALPAAAAASSSAKIVDRGIVQSVAPTQIVLKALDGSVISFRVSRSTRVRVNRVKAPLGAIAPGFVATVAHDRKGRASLIEAVGTPVTTTDRGVVTAFTPSATAMTIRTADGASLTVQVDRTTRFLFKGALGGRGLARPGAVVTVTHAGDASALVVTVLKRAEA